MSIDEFKEMTVEEIRIKHCSKYRSNPIDHCVGCQFFKFSGMSKRCTLLVYHVRTGKITKRI